MKLVSSLLLVISSLFVSWHQDLIRRKGNQKHFTAIVSSSIRTIMTTTESKKKSGNNNNNNNKNEKIIDDLIKNHDKEVSSFNQKVYRYCGKVPEGKVTTYKELAKAIGHPKAFRAVGTALRNNPFAPTVPCHRVVASDLSLGGFSGSKDPDGPCLKRKVKLLSQEGVQFDQPDVVKEERSTKRLKVTEDAVYCFN